MKTVLITGALGFLGNALRKELVKEGFCVIGVDQKDQRDEDVVGIDLLATTARNLLLQLPCPDCVVHLAALAHNQKPSLGQTCYNINMQMTKVVLEAFADKVEHFVMASSVAVYGEAERPQRIEPCMQLTPSSEYGRSKLGCEQMLLESAIRDISILRFCPIYSKDRLQDIAKRVYVPGIPWVRMRVFPSPCYSLCHINSAVQHLVASVQRGQGRTVCNVSDTLPYSQKQLLKWFKGPIIPFPSGMVRFLLWVLRKISSTRIYAVRCNLEKLFFTHLYSDKKDVLSENG